MTTNPTTAPTIDRIRQLLREAGGYMGMSYDSEADCLVYAAERQTLSPHDIQAAWDRIAPDDNEGNISDPDTQVVFGAFMGSGELWVELADAE